MKCFIEYELEIKNLSKTTRKQHSMSSNEYQNEFPLGVDNRQKYSFQSRFAKYLYFLTSLHGAVLTNLRPFLINLIFCRLGLWLFSVLYGEFKGVFACCVFPNPFQSEIHSPFSIFSFAQTNTEVMI